MDHELFHTVCLRPPFLLLPAFDMELQTKIVGSAMEFCLHL